MFAQLYPRAYLVICSLCYNDLVHTSLDTWLLVTSRHHSDTDGYYYPLFEGEIIIVLLRITAKLVYRSLCIRDDDPIYCVLEFPYEV